MTVDSDFVAVETKLLAPERRPGFVERPRLVDALEAGRARRVTVISAPTGFGKTSALTEWGASSPARFAWVSLDEGDADPARFWTYLVAAVEGAAPELPGTSGRRLRGSGVTIADEVIPVLVNELAMVTAPLVLVLDDYHAISADDVHGGVNYLLERLPPDVHVVIAGQAAPPLRLGRLRARDELNEYRAEQLRFSEAEVATLLNGTHRLRLTPEDLAGLHRRTEGWVAGLNLVALTLRDTGDRAAFLAGLPVDDRFLVDYLWDEVVAQQAPATREFLMRTAVLERLSGSLCDAVAERTGSDEMLRSLERSNLFVVPLDAERRWFRYHALFRAMLVRQLERFAPDSVADLHRRASAWYADHGDLHGTIEHAICAGDVNVAADALRRNWLALYSGGHATEAIEWIGRLPDATVDEYPELALARAGMARAMGRADEVEPWLERAERSAPAGDRERRELGAGVARQRSMLRLSRADVGEAVRFARAAVALRPPDSAEVPSDAFFLAVCLFWTGSTRECETLLRGYLDSVEPGEQDVRRVFALALLALAHAARGELDPADRLAAESLATTEARGTRRASADRDGVRRVRRVRARARRPRGRGGPARARGHARAPRWRPGRDRPVTAVARALPRPLRRRHRSGRGARRGTSAARGCPGAGPGRDRRGARSGDRRARNGGSGARGRRRPHRRRDPRPRAPAHRPHLAGDRGPPRPLPRGGPRSRPRDPAQARCRDPRRGRRRRSAARAHLICVSPVSGSKSTSRSLPGAAPEHVGPRAAAQHVVAGAADQAGRRRRRRAAWSLPAPPATRVVAAPRDHDVVPGAAVEAVGAAAAAQQVVAAAARDPVVDRPGRTAGPGRRCRGCDRRPPCRRRARSGSRSRADRRSHAA